MSVHTLKCWPSYFRDLRAGYKTFEVRKNDRDFRPGDDLEIHEWDPKYGQATGAVVALRVTYVCDLTPVGCPGYVGMSVVFP